MKVETNALLAGLSRLSATALMETIFMAVFLVSMAAAINYLMDWYFLEKRYALIDELTGLYNRKAMKRWLLKEIDRAKRFQHPLSLMMIDIDFFKQYNDRNGHLAGDALLTRIGKIFRMSMKSGRL